MEVILLCSNKRNQCSYLFFPTKFPVHSHIMNLFCLFVFDHLLSAITMVWLSLEKSHFHQIACESLLFSPPVPPVILLWFLQGLKASTQPGKWTQTFQTLNSARQWNFFGIFGDQLFKMWKYPQSLFVCLAVFKFLWAHRWKSDWVSTGCIINNYHQHLSVNVCVVFLFADWYLHM